MYVVCDLASLFPLLSDVVKHVFYCVIGQVSAMFDVEYVYTWTLMGAS